MNICVGGTFYPFHKGHKTLLRKACEVAGSSGSVFIGLTSDQMAQKKGKIASFPQRKKIIQGFLAQEGCTPHVTIQPLFDPYGPSVIGEFDAIVVSPETKVVAEEINSKRREKGKKPLEIIVIPFVLAEDGRPISSTRIRNKEIDENGVVLKEE
jgi:pantetheine-phosphate adenylyltransferase